MGFRKQWKFPVIPYFLTFPGHGFVRAASGRAGQAQRIPSNRGGDPSYASETAPAANRQCFYDARTGAPPAPRGRARPGAWYTEDIPAGR